MDIEFPSEFLVPETISSNKFLRELYPRDILERRRSDNEDTCSLPNIELPVTYPGLMRRKNSSNTSKSDLLFYKNLTSTSLSKRLPENHYNENYHDHDEDFLPKSTADNLLDNLSTDKDSRSSTIDILDCTVDASTQHFNLTSKESCELSSDANTITPDTKLYWLDPVPSDLEEEEKRRKQEDLEFAELKLDKKITKFLQIIAQARPFRTLYIKNYHVIRQELENQGASKELGEFNFAIHKFLNTRNVLEYWGELEKAINQIPADKIKNATSSKKDTDSTDKHTENLAVKAAKDSVAYLLTDIPKSFYINGFLKDDIEIGMVLDEVPTEKRKSKKSKKNEKALLNNNERFASNIEDHLLSLPGLPMRNNCCEQKISAKNQVQFYCNYKMCSTLKHINSKIFEYFSEILVNLEKEKAPADLTDTMRSGYKNLRRSYSNKEFSKILFRYIFDHEPDDVTISVLKVREAAYKILKENYNQENKLFNGVDKIIKHVKSIGFWKYLKEDQSRAIENWLKNPNEHPYSDIQNELAIKEFIEYVTGKANKLK